MIVIDGGMMSAKESAHAYLAERLSLPDHYGGNLDALYDVLTAEMTVPTCLILYRWQALGPYGTSLLAVMQDAAQENPYLRIIFDGEEE